MKSILSKILTGGGKKYAIVHNLFNNSFEGSHPHLLQSEEVA